MDVGLPLEGAPPPADPNWIHVENGLDGGFPPSETPNARCYVVMSRHGKPRQGLYYVASSNSPNDAVTIFKTEPRETGEGS
jgi:hypothetical protein